TTTETGSDGRPPTADHRPPTDGEAACGSAMGGAERFILLPPLSVVSRPVVGGRWSVVGGRPSLVVCHALRPRVLAAPGNRSPRPPGARGRGAGAPALRRRRSAGRRRRR